MSNFQSLYVGRNSLRAHRTALDVISHNMANAAVPGYSRQLAYYDDAQGKQHTLWILGNGGSNRFSWSECSGHLGAALRSRYEQLP